MSKKQFVTDRTLTSIWGKCGSRFPIKEVVGDILTKIDTDILLKRVYKSIQNSLDDFLFKLQPFMIKVMAKITNYK